MHSKCSLLLVFAALFFDEISLSSIKRKWDSNGDSILINRPKLNHSSAHRDYIRRKRYLGLSKHFKLNRRYQECVAPGDVAGHCKHLSFCPMDVLGKTKQAIDYLCVIEKMHVGVCCPDDIILDTLHGSSLILDLPAGGFDYDEGDEEKGCGILPKKSYDDTIKAVQEWPWIAALYKTNPNEEYFCGGALITDRHILTAAHCTTGFTPQEIKVRLGEYDFRKHNETRSRNYNVAKIIEHEEYYRPTYANDIAILVLEKPSSFDSYIWPICLPPVNRSYVGKMAIVAGWGQTFYNGPISEVLLQVKVPVWPLENCSEAFLQSITENNICAAAYEGGKDSCKGDSGGPLLYQLENKRWVTIGIVSWGIRCGEVGKPGIYTRVDKYLPWIIKNSLTDNTQ